MLRLHAKGISHACSETESKVASSKQCTLPCLKSSWPESELEKENLVKIVLSQKQKVLKEITKRHNDE
jgi:hypothetical protein